MFRKIKNLFRNIKRVLRWIPIIWKDREYDHSYLLQIISFKLKLMEEFYRSKYAVSADWKDVATKIHICKLLCDRLIADDYYDMLNREVEINWDADLSNNFDLTNDKDPNLKIKGISFKTLNEGCQLGICRDWIHYESYMQHQDLEYLCRIIQKHLFKWWD